LIWAFWLSAPEAGRDGWTVMSTQPACEAARDFVIGRVLLSDGTLRVSGCHEMTPEQLAERRDRAPFDTVPFSPGY
jgi:hypothetical protein